MVLFHTLDYSAAAYNGVCGICNIIVYSHWFAPFYMGIEVATHRHPWKQGEKHEGSD